ncbi:Serpentine Receptor, class I [Caenorhabditis elegans]|uniref:Serpentine Receptor, class I n=1 Tax=Caenorhabditis elegans TaxID=6239 RepID=P91551_CAEEL|nr:Serpentine Receptor, class I [Caenorhabditis elegans]CCD64933.1 Serpentine Receptor, class I [Caenorhabditis elegans]|eukprot:NP_494469.1 Serpentine Receptor, class I [Caenorhabditis elegans]
MLIDFTVTFWLRIYCYIVAIASFPINFGTIMLITYKSDKIDNFKYFMLWFQITNSITDLYMAIFAQPMSLLPIWAVHCVGFAATYLNIWSNYLFSLLPALVAVQFVSLGLAFLKKHQSIASIARKHLISELGHNIFRACVTIWPIFTFSLFCAAAVNREEQMDYVREHYPGYASEFAQLKNFAIYRMNIWMTISAILFIWAFIVFGSITFYTTFDMFQMLNGVQKKISIRNYNREKAVVRSLVAQLIASTIIAVPGFAFLACAFWATGDLRTIIEIIIVLFLLRGSIHSVILIATTSPYKKYILRKIPRKMPPTSSIIVSLT